MKEQRRIEIENLKNAKGEMKQEKFSKKEQLSKRAAQIAERAGASAPSSASPQ